MSGLKWQKQRQADKARFQGSVSSDAESERLSGDRASKWLGAVDANSKKRKAMRRKARVAASPEISVRAFLGAHGIRTSEIQLEDDLWSVASTLWPQRVRCPKNGDLGQLRFQISKISKKDRRDMAAENLKHVDPRFVSGAEKHQRKIDPEFSDRLAAVSDQLRAPA
jgi:hypothetical protein